MMPTDNLITGLLRPLPVILTNIVSLFPCALPSVCLYPPVVFCIILVTSLGKGLFFLLCFVQSLAQWDPVT